MRGLFFVKSFERVSRGKTALCPLLVAFLGMENCGKKKNSRQITIISVAKESRRIRKIRGSLLERFLFEATNLRA